MAAEATGMSVQHLTPPAGTSKADLETLRAGCGNEEGSRQSVRALLARDPAWIERIGTLAGHAEQAILAMAQGQVLVEEAWRAELIAVRTSLYHPGDGALERLLVQRVALCWLALSIAELTRASCWKEGTSTETGELWDRRVSRLNRDFLQASKTLAAARRLRLPTLQVNVGAQQVNVVR